MHAIFQRWISLRTLHLMPGRCQLLLLLLLLLNTQWQHAM